MPGRKSPGVFVFQLFDEIDLCDNRGVAVKSTETGKQIDNR